jgi:hypothetical protein
MSAQYCNPNQSVVIGSSAPNQMAGSLGWVNVQVRPVDCSVGLGVKMP